MAGGSGPRRLRPAARQADVWNRGFDIWNPGVERYSPEELAARRPRVDAACLDVGLAPGALERPAGVLIELPGSPDRGALLRRLRYGSRACWGIDRRIGGVVAA